MAKKKTTKKKTLKKKTKIKTVRRSVVGKNAMQSRRKKLKISAVMLWNQA